MSQPSSSLGAILRGLAWSLLLYPSAALLGMVLAWAIMIGTVIVGILIHGTLSLIEGLPTWALLLSWLASLALLSGLVVATLWIKRRHSGDFPWWMAIYVLANPGHFVFSHHPHCGVHEALTFRDHLAAVLLAPISTTLFAFAATMLLFALRNKINRSSTRTLLGQTTLLGLGWAFVLWVTGFDPMATSSEFVVFLGLGLVLAPLPFTVRQDMRLSTTVCHHLLLVCLQIMTAMILVFSMTTIEAFVLSPAHVFDVWQLPTP